MKKLTLALIILALLFPAVDALAQSGGVSGSNKITGVIRGGGDPLKGARVTILDSSRNPLATMTNDTDVQGRYQIRGLPCGTYYMKVEAEGFESLEVSFSCFEETGSGGVRGAVTGGGVEKNINLLPQGTTITPREDLEPFPDKAARSYTKALKKMDKGDMDGAEKILDEVLEMDPGFYYARAKLGEIHKLEGRTDQAKTELATAVEQNPNEVMGRVHLASIHIKAGELEQAAALLEQAVAVAPGYADAWFNLGLCCSQLEGQADRAEEALLKALELDAAELADARLLLANTYLGQNKLRDALNQMETWLDLGIESPMTPRVKETVKALREDLDLAE
jgi:tetratricopeptide (TPR) repeat protein